MAKRQSQISSNYIRVVELYFESYQNMRVSGILKNYNADNKETWTINLKLFVVLILWFLI